MSVTNKGFLLVDSLVSVLICSLVCILCYSIYQANEKYLDGYSKYQEESNDRLVNILGNINECETCEVSDESD